MTLLLWNVPKRQNDSITMKRREYKTSVIPRAMHGANNFHVPVTHYQ